MDDGVGGTEGGMEGGIDRGKTGRTDTQREEFHERKNKAVCHDTFLVGTRAHMFLRARVRVPRNPFNHAPTARFNNSTSILHCRTIISLFRWAEAPSTLIHSFLNLGNHTPSLPVAIVPRARACVMPKSTSDHAQNCEL